MSKWSTLFQPSIRARASARPAAGPRLYDTRRRSSLIARQHGRYADRYLGDASELAHGTRLKWFVSTCIAAAVGVAAIGAVIYGSIDSDEHIESAGKVDRRSVWERVWDMERLRPALQGPRPEPRDVEQAAVKQDRLPQTIGGMLTRHVIHDSERQRRGAREVVVIHAYTRITGRLATTPPVNEAKIPPFNPFRLYANLEPIEEGTSTPGAGRGGDNEVAVKVVELLGGFLPEEDGQELEAEEVGAIVARSGAEIAERAEIRKTFTPDGAETPKDTPAAGTSKPAAARVVTAPSDGADGTDAGSSPVKESAGNTTVLVKSPADGDDETDAEGKEVVTERVTSGETLMSILRKVGTEIWQAREIVDVANTTFPIAQLKEGHEIRMTLVPSPTNAKRQVPVKVAIMADGQQKVAVVRSAAGAYVLAGGGADAEIGTANNDAGQQLASVYTSLYATLSRQNVPQDIVELILRTNAYDIDFKRRVHPGDGFELFFDQKEADQSDDTTAGELLYTSLSAGGVHKKFYRFRTPDGVVEFYDQEGNNSKRFLMRKPVRGEEARLADGFGMRMHPLWRIRKMHTGLDWAAPSGTPILAAGNGVIEEVGRKGGYGNYVRIRHANGYKTAYGHMQRFAAGVGADVRVRQGQIIGFVGQTGDVTGPHLHFEILVNNSFVDPMRIQVPRERRLTGKELDSFRKESMRIEELMRRPPVSSRMFADTDTLEQKTAAQPAPLSTSAIVPRSRRQ